MAQIRKRKVLSGFTPGPGSEPGPAPLSKAGPQLPLKTKASPTLPPPNVHAPVVTSLGAVSLGSCTPLLPPASSKLATARKDAPVINYTTRAASSKSMPLLEEDKPGLMEELRRDRHAASAQGPQDSLLKTWITYHRRWFGENDIPFPTSPVAVEAVAAQMKNDKYRSFANYLSRAKTEHIRSGGVWDQLLELTGKACSHSVNRGIGPAKQSAAYSILEVAALAVVPAPLVNDGPVNPQHLMLLGGFFLTREIELSCALANHMRVNWRDEKPFVAWKLPATKTDPQAASTTREWGCLCGETGKTVALCPAHVAIDHLKLLEHRFGSEQIVSGELPLFPNEEGGFCTKESVVESIEHIAAMTGASLQDDMGRRAFGGHSCRVSGARYLASIGMELFKMMVLARWAGPTILRYVSESPLVHITDDVKRLMAGEELHDVLKALTERCHSLDDKIAELADKERSLAEEVRFVAATNRMPAFAKNCKSGVWHRILWDGADVAPALWKTHCGWQFAGCVVERSAELPGSVPWRMLCDRCLAPERIVAKTNDNCAGSDDDR